MTCSSDPVPDVLSRNLCGAADAFFTFEFKQVSFYRLGRMCVELYSDIGVNILDQRLDIHPLGIALEQGEELSLAFCTVCENFRNLLLRIYDNKPMRRINLRNVQAL